MASRWRIWHIMVVVAVLAVVFAIARTELGSSSIFFALWVGTVLLVLVMGPDWSVSLGERVRELVGRGKVGETVGLLTAVFGTILSIVTLGIVTVFWTIAAGVFRERVLR